MGPKFFCCSKMAVTRRRSKLWWRKAHQSKALDVSYLSSLSKRDLKPSGTQILKLLPPAGILREPFYKIFQKIGPCGHIRGTLLQNIPTFWPLRAYQGDPFTKYSNILAPAGILGEPFYKKNKLLAPAGIIGEPFYKIFQNNLMTCEQIDRPIKLIN